MTDFPGAGTSGTVSPGVLLAAARKASGLSVADVAAQMRIAPRQVEAIEADHYDQLPGAVFVRGFVRNYARLLRMDPTPLLHALEPALGDDEPLRAQHYAGTLPVPLKKNHTRAWLSALGVVLAVVLGAGLYEYWRSRRAADAVPPPPPVAPSPVAPPVESPPAGTAPLERGEPVPLVPERVPDTPAQSGAATPGSGSAANAVSVGSATEAPPTTRLDRLAVEFTQESWLEVRDRAGKIVFMGTGSANTVRRFEAEGPLNIVVGNAPAVRITYNDKPVDVSAHAARNIARFSLE